MELLVLIALVLMISSFHHHCQAFAPPSILLPSKHHRQVFTLFMSATDPIETEVSSMRVKEIKDELESYGISTRTFLEKGELVEALVRARKEGKRPSSNDSTKKSKKKKRRSSNDDDVEEEVKAKVEVITSDNVGPKTKKSRDSSQQGSSSNPFGGGGGGSPFGGMDIGDILKNMGGASMGGAAGANPFGGMGGGDAMKGMLCCDAFIS